MISYNERNNKSKGKKQSQTHKREEKRTDTKKNWYFMAINYHVVCFMMRSFPFDIGKLKRFVCVCVLASPRACLLYHLFRKMAIYTEFDHLLLVGDIVWLFWHWFFSLSASLSFLFNFNYAFSGGWSSVNWSNLRKMADKWKVWKTFIKILS